MWHQDNAWTARSHAVGGIGVQTLKFGPLTLRNVNKRSAEGSADALFPLQGS